MAEEVKSVPVIQPNGQIQEPKAINEPVVVVEAIDDKGEPTKVATVKDKVEPNKPEPKKFFEHDDWKTEFGDDTPEILKTYKTKASEYESKVKELESQKIEFANDRIKQLNELAKNGIEIDEKTVAFLNKDYNKIENPLAGLAEHLKNQNPTWSDKKIDFELRQKYRLDQLKVEKDDDGNDVELTDAQKEIEEIVKEDVERDWQDAKKSLIEKQDKLRIVKPRTQTEIEAEKKDAEDSAKSWDETVKNISEKNTKIKVEFPKELQKLMNDAKEEIAPFEFEVTKEDREKAANLFHNPQNFWKEFADKDGNLNNDESRAKIHNAMLFVVSGQKAMQKLAETQYKAGREFEIKHDKKISMTPNKATSGNTQGKVPVVQPR